VGDSIRNPEPGHGVQPHYEAQLPAGISGPGEHRPVRRGPRHSHRAPGGGVSDPRLCSKPCHRPCRAPSPPTLSPDARTWTPGLTPERPDARPRSDTEPAAHVLDVRVAGALSDRR